MLRWLRLCCIGRFTTVLYRELPTLSLPLRSMHEGSDSEKS